jgi:hypothetical protein
MNRDELDANLGAMMLASAIKEKKVAKLPAGRKGHYGPAVSDPEQWRLKVQEFVAVLEGKPPQTRDQVAKALGCSKETVKKRADIAIKQGMVRKIPTKRHSKINPVFVYALAKPSYARRITPKEEK